MKDQHTVLVTGATGFLGGHLVHRLLDDGFTVHAAARQVPSKPNGCKNYLIPDISADTNWHDALKNCDVVVHTAARVHVMNERNKGSIKIYRKINVEGTMNLALQAAKRGVKRFIFISSIKVNGEQTHPKSPYRADDVCKPKEPYALSKYEAEQALLALSKNVEMEIVIIRPTLIYGPGVKGNFLQLLRLVKRNRIFPLPARAVKNKRSFVSVLNLVQLIMQCMIHPKAANQVFLVSDGIDLSVSQLLQKMGQAMQKEVKIMCIPLYILEGIAACIGKRESIRRLTNSLHVDITKTCELLHWHPHVNMDEALVQTIERDVF